MKKNFIRKTHALIIILYIIIVGILYFKGYNAGKSLFKISISFGLNMLKYIPAAFVLIGLFETWVKRESVEKHLGENSGFLAYFWMILLASTSVGGIYVAFPLASLLYIKGARLSIIFSYIGFAGICRIPMTIFEASYLGIKFTIIRILVSISLVIISSIFLEKYLKNDSYIKNKLLHKHDFY